MDLHVRRTHQVRRNTEECQFEGHLWRVLAFRLCGNSSTFNENSDQNQEPFPGLQNAQWLLTASQLRPALLWPCQGLLASTCLSSLPTSRAGLLALPKHTSNIPVSTPSLPPGCSSSCSGPPPCQARCPVLQAVNSCDQGFTTGKPGHGSQLQSHHQDNKHLEFHFGAHGSTAQPCPQPLREALLFQPTPGPTLQG